MQGKVTTRVIVFVAFFVRLLPFLLGIVQGYKNASYMCLTIYYPLLYCTYRCGSLVYNSAPLTSFSRVHVTYAFLMAFSSLFSLSKFADAFIKFCGLIHVDGIKRSFTDFSDERSKICLPRNL